MEYKWQFAKNVGGNKGILPNNIGTKSKATNKLNKQPYQGCEIPKNRQASISGLPLFIYVFTGNYLSEFSALFVVPSCFQSIPNGNGIGIQERTPAR